MTNKIKIALLSVLLLSGCIIYRQSFTVGGQEYNKKQFDILCGELTITAVGRRGDFLLELDFNLRDSTFLYGDSLQTTLGSKVIEHSFERVDTLIGKEDRGVYIEIPPTYWTKNKKDTVTVDFNGVFYCREQKVDFRKLLIIE